MTGLAKLAMPHDVFLLRHGQTEWNKEHRVQGQKNSDLTELGRTQARQQAEILRGTRPTLGVHTLWASPLGRAQETARLAFDDAPFLTDARLSEINCGAWEGTTHEDRLARDPCVVVGLQSEYDMYTSGPGRRHERTCRAPALVPIGAGWAGSHRVAQSRHRGHAGAFDWRPGWAGLPPGPRAG